MKNQLLCVQKSEFLTYLRFHTFCVFEIWIVTYCMKKHQKRTRLYIEIFMMRNALSIVKVNLAFQLIWWQKFYEIIACVKLIENLSYILGISTVWQKLWGLREFDKSKMISCQTRVSSYLYQNNKKNTQQINVSCMRSRNSLHIISLGSWQGIWKSFFRYVLAGAGVFRWWSILKMKSFCVTLNLWNSFHMLLLAHFRTIRPQKHQLISER